VHRESVPRHAHSWNASASRSPTSTRGSPLSMTGASRPGEQGEILLRTPAMMLAHFHDPDETRRAIVDGWLHTATSAIATRTAYLYITDRRRI